MLPTLRVFGNWVYLIQILEKLGVARRVCSSLIMNGVVANGPIILIDTESDTAMVLGTLQFVLVTIINCLLM